MTKRKIELTDYEQVILQRISQLAEKDNLFLVNITKVAPSGMSRTMKLHLNPAVITEAARPVNVTALASKVLGYPLNDNGLRVSGCGMDMVFHVLYGLTCAADKHAGAGRPANMFRAANNYYLV